MALTDKSKWRATGFSSSGIPEESKPSPEPVTGLTGHQERMVGARHPAGGLQPNVVVPKEEKGTTAAERGQIEQQGEKLQKQQERQQAAEQGGFQAKVDELASKIGNFGYTLQAKVQQLLSGAAKTMGVKDESLMKVGPDGKVTISDQVSADPAAIAQQKLQEQGAVRRTLSPYTEQIGGKTVAKSFNQVVKDLMGDDQSASYAVQLLDTIDSLNKSGAGNSVEARAALQQLEALDHSGLISGLFRAKKQYEQYMGIPGSDATVKWYGDEGTKGYTALDLADLQADEITKEVENSLNFSSGLFGGDYESSVRRLFDKESADIAESNRKKEAIRNEMYQGFKNFTDEMGGKFSEAREAYDLAFRQAANKIVEALNANGQTQEAKMWAEAMAGGHMDTLLYKLMNDPDSGMSAEQRKSIRDWIGAVGEKSGGQLFSWLNSLAQTGQFTVKDSAGNMVTVEPDAQQKLQILNIMSSDLPADRKTEELNKIVKSWSVGLGSEQTIGHMVGDALQSALKTGNTDQALETLQKSLVESMKTFAGSFTEDVVREKLGITDEKWNALTKAQRSELIRTTLADPANAKLLEGKMQDLYAGAKQQRDMWNTALTTASENIQKRTESLNKEAVFDNKGELTGGRLFDLLTQAKSGIPMLQDKIKEQVTGLFYQYSSQYFSMLSAHPVVQQLVRENKATHVDVVNMSRAYSISQALTRLKAQSPQLYEMLVAKRGIVQSSYKDAVDRAIQKGDMAWLASTVHTFEKDFLEVLQAGKMDRVFHDFLSKIGKGTVSGAFDNALKLRMTAMNNRVRNVENGISEAKRAYYQNTLTMKAINEIRGRIDDSVFDPESILKFSLGVAKQQEKGAPLAVGVEELKKLGIKPEDVQTINGVPYVKMGDGTYVPLDEERMTQLLGATSDFVPSAQETEGVDVSGVAVGGGEGPIAPVDVKAPVPVEPLKGGGTVQVVKGAGGEGRLRISNIESTGTDNWTVTYADGTIEAYRLPPGTDMKAFTKMLYDRSGQNTVMAERAGFWHSLGAALEGTFVSKAATDKLIQESKKGAERDELIEQIIGIPNMPMNLANMTNEEMRAYIMARRMEDASRGKSPSSGEYTGSYQGAADAPRGTPSRTERIA